MELPGLEKSKCKALRRIASHSAEGLFQSPSNGSEALVTGQPLPFSAWNNYFRAKDTDHKKSAQANTPITISYAFISQRLRWLQASKSFLC